MNIERLAAFIMLSFFLGVAFGALLLSGCASTPTRQFNTEDIQDPSCYATYGGLRGFCDAIESNK